MRKSCWSRRREECASLRMGAHPRGSAARFHVAIEDDGGDEAQDDGERHAEERRMRRAGEVPGPPGVDEEADREVDEEEAVGNAAKPDEEPVARPVLQRLGAS